MFLAILLLFVIVACVLGGMIVLGTKPPPPPLESIEKAFAHVDLSNLPALQTYRARDGSDLAYRAYSGSDSDVAVLIHGSSSRSDDMHPMAGALNAAGFTVYALDIRGHGGSGPHGDISYVGQLDDDMADFVKFIRLRHRNAVISLVGFSSGGGFVLRIAGGSYGGIFDRYLLISPALPYNAPTIRPGTGGWAVPFIPRIIALRILDRIGIHWFEMLPVLAFAVQPRMENAMTSSYSYRLQRNFEPHQDYLEDIRRSPRSMAVLVGGSDELFFPDQFEPLFHSVRSYVPVTVIPGLDHIEMSLSPAAFSAIISALQH
jgi:non-heme chloroperoxidase